MTRVIEYRGRSVASFCDGLSSSVMILLDDNMLSLLSMSMSVSRDVKEDACTNRQLSVV